jgi:replicative DNA helicase
VRAFDAEVEVKIIKTILDTQHKSYVLSKINADYLGLDETKEVFKRISTLINAGKAIPSSDVFKNDSVLTEQTRAIISNQNNKGYETLEDIDTALDILNKYRKARILYQSITIAIEKLKDPSPDIDNVVSNLSESLHFCHAGTLKSEMVHFSKEHAKEIVDSVEQELRNRADDFIQTGLTEFDKKSGGWRRTNVIAMASTPGGGKSALALQLAANQYLLGYSVIMISYEMDEIELKYRLLASVSRISHSDINLNRITEKQIKIINERFHDFLSSGEGKFTIWCPNRELNVYEITTEIKPYNYDAVYIDYINLLREEPKKNQHEVLGAHARAAKLCAKQMNNVIVLLAQLDEQSEHIKYSKAIEAHANMVWTWLNDKRAQETNIIEVKQLKARNSPVYSFLLFFDRPVMQVRSYIGPNPNEVLKGDEKPEEIKMPSMPELI